MSGYCHDQEKSTLARIDRPAEVAGAVAAPGSDVVEPVTSDLRDKLCRRLTVLADEFGAHLFGLLSTKIAVVAVAIVEPVIAAVGSRYETDPAMF